MERTEEHCEKIFKSLKGKVKTDEHRKRISDKLISYDWSSYTERNTSISIKNSGSNNGRSKSIKMLNSAGEIVNIFHTMDEARNFLISEYGIKLSKSTFWRRITSETSIEGFIFSPN